MYSLLLAIIYLAFISLGLPDSILGSVWPAMRVDFGVPLSYAGIVTMLISLCTIISSLMSNKLNRSLGTGRVTAISVFVSAFSLFGFSLSRSFWMLIIFAIPYGLGAGAIDSALNNYVALHYSSKQMSWLHCFWGVGTIISPYILSMALSGGAGWNNGYRIVFYIQLCIAAILLFTLPVWKRVEKKHHFISNEELGEAPTLKSVIKLPGVKPIMLGFFAYCALESVFSLWASTYFVEVHNVSVDIAASYAAFTYIGVTFGRFIAGFFAEKLGDKRQIRIGLCVILVSLIFIAVPAKSHIPAMIGFILGGIGCAPIYPSIVHSTPVNFGANNSQAIIGMQMAFAYLGYTFIPLVFGIIAEKVSPALLPVFLLFFTLFVALMTEIVNRIVKNKREIIEH